MATTTTTDTPRLTAEVGNTIAAHLTPGPWEVYQDENLFGEQARGERLALRYVGEDVTLAGAELRAYVLTRGTTIEWTCTMTSPATLGGKYLLDFLPYASRKAWPGSRVNISLNKTAERIGREVSRRLIGHYLPAYQEGMAGLQLELTRQDGDRDLAAELAELAGTKPWQMNNQGNMPWRVNVGHWRLCCEYGSVRVDATAITPDQARQLVALVKTWES